MSNQEQERSSFSTLSSLDLSEKLIRERAYQLFEQRGYEHGHDVDDWLEAEAEVRCKKPARADLDTTLRKATAA